jgi:hypothetical protein
VIEKNNVFFRKLVEIKLFSCVYSLHLVVLRQDFFLEERN